MSMARTEMPFVRWLAILVSLLMLAPVAAGVAGWAIASEVQNGHQDSLARAAERVLAHPRAGSPRWLAAAVARLQRLGVPAHLEANGTGDVATRNFKPADAPTQTNATRYRQIDVNKTNLAAILLIPRANSTVAWLVAVRSGLAALLAAIVAAGAAVRRWIARPLVRLAAGAEQIAAGDLECDRVSSPVREISVVGDAQHGMARSLAEALRTAHAADHERRFLITAIAHDLRTPLFTLRGSLEALELGIGDRSALQRAKQKAAHLDQLVNDLFTFSRLEYAHEPHHYRPFDVRNTAQHAVDSIATIPAADTRTIGVELPAEPALLYSDETAVARILTNLLDNAIRHARRQVQLRIHPVRDQIALEIADDGPGFAPSALPHIFDAFYQADGSRTRNGGAGLGLTIVHRLVTALGGGVTAANRPDSGASVVVTLPTAAPPGAGDDGWRSPTA